MDVIQTNQIVIPKQLYIGDRAELRCTFNSDLEFLRNAVLKSNQIFLDMSGFTRNISPADLEITKIQFLSSGADYYTLEISFIPWKTGTIEFPEFDLGQAFGTEPFKNVLKFQSVQITSLIEGDSSATLRNSESPILLPGTKYKLAGAGIALLILLVVLIHLFIKRKEVSLYIKNQILLHKYRINKKLTEKKLRNLMGDIEMDSHDIAEEIQKILREYLEFRFDYPFTHALTSELMDGFYKATQHLLSSQKEDAFVEIASTFTRTDYIRYRKGASFNMGEKEALISKIIENIEIIETPDADKSPDYDENATEEAH